MAEKMKAQVFYEGEKMDLEEIPVPEVTDVDVLVQVKNCGICGSDISYYYGMSPVGTATGKGPLVLGHEPAGIVEQVGEDVTYVKPGDHVIACLSVFCGTCEYCTCSAG